MSRTFPRQKAFLKWLEPIGTPATMTPSCGCFTWTLRASALLRGGGMWESTSWIWTNLFRGPIRLAGQPSLLLILAPMHTTARNSFCSVQTRQDDSPLCPQLPLAERIFLPIRLGGGGLTSSKTTRKAAYIGSIALAAKMIGTLLPSLKNNASTSPCPPTYSSSNPSRRQRQTLI
jgi:hypothetical protein